MTEQERDLLFAELKESILSTEIWKSFSEILGISQTESEAIMRTIPMEEILGPEPDAVLEDYKQYIRPKTEKDGAPQYAHGEEVN